MNEKFFVESVIREEFGKIEASGKTIKLKSASKMIATRWIWTVVITAVLAIVFFPAAIIFFIIRAVKYHTVSNVDVIFRLAKENPDTPIVDIITEELM